MTPAIARWAQAAHGPAVSALSEEPRRHGGTWAVGLDLLPNAPDGSIAGTPLPWEDLGLPPCPLHPAQLSTVFPGYPLHDADETETAHRFRLARDAAHLDGLLPIGPDKRRMMKEPHAWILGLALTPSDGSPLVVYEGSAPILQQALAQALAPHPPETWGDIDLTEPYAQARRKVFATCPRVEIRQSPGQAVILHRLTLHGVAPWATGAKAPPEGRIIAYFRPMMPSVADWLRQP